MSARANHRKISVQYHLNLIQGDGRQAVVPIGFLEKDPLTGVYFFEYNFSLHKLLNHIGPIDPVNLPIKKGKIVLGKKCTGIIRDAMPDWWGKLLITNMLDSRTELSAFDFLLLNDPMRSGNLTFSAIGNPDADKALPTFRKSNLALAFPSFKALDKEKHIPANNTVFPFMLYGSSLGGGRPKCSVEDENGIPWLAKLPSCTDVWSNARVEYAFLHMARRCGINAAQSFVEQINGDDVLFLERFDRIRQNGVSMRIPFISANSCLQIGDDNKEMSSYLRLADMIRRIGNDEDLLELFKRMAYNVLCRNIDDHAKNHGFIRIENEWRLSPAYDILPTPWVLNMNAPATHSMLIGEYSRKGTVENMLSGAHRFGLSKEEALAIINNVSDILSNSWTNVFDQMHIAQSDVDRLRPLADSWGRRDTGDRDKDGHPEDSEEDEHGASLKP